MKAMLLNSGVGNRLRPFTDSNPKCLIKINHDTILEHEIKNLLHYGIRDIIITTGFFEEKIKDLIKNKFPEANVKYAKSDKPDTTNAIYSMWLARYLADDDILLMHGDMIFDKELLGRLLKSKHPSCALVNNKIELPEKDFKARINGGTVMEIGVDVFGKDAFFLAPVYRISKKDFRLWMEEISKFIKRKDVTVYAENAFNNISSKLKLYPVYYQDEFCMEIDNFDDLQKARKFFRRK
ncbi:phosphocholine cytidylyltransferase family protein [Candidatus Woesearchaeota archaeon]|nr:phosphocholine cytidylyltransferase family protein [Candidatus Woesearchaeota archaeon]